MLPTDSLPDWIQLSCYLQAHYRTVYYCSTTHGSTTRALCYPRSSTRRYTTVLLPTVPLLDCILLFCYPQVHYRTLYYWSATHMSTTRLDSTVLLPIGPLTYCILLFCYPQAHYYIVYLSCYPQSNYEAKSTVLPPTGPTSRLYSFVLLLANYQTVFFCSVTHKHTTRLYVLFCCPQASSQTVYFCSATH